jgi:hypothetical protein
LPCIKKVSVKKCHLAGPIEKLATTFLSALYLEVLDFLMGCDLENIYVKAERYTSEKSVHEN